MKRKITIVGFLAVCMLIMVQAVPAVEYSTIVETYKKTLFERTQNIDIHGKEEFIKSIDINKLKERSEDKKDDQFILTLITLLLKFLVTITSIICPFKIIPLILIFIAYIYFLIVWG